MHHREPRSPNAQDLELIELASHLARVALERDRGENALRASEKKYRELIDAAPDAIFVWDSQGKCVLFNGSAARLYCGSEDEMIGLSWAETYLPAERDLVPKRFDQVKKQGVLRFERQFLRKNNEVVPVEVSLSTAGDDQYQGVVRDISDRKRAEALLAGEKRILEKLAKGGSLSQILDSLCRLVEEQATGVLASILLLDGNRLRHGGAPSLPKAYTDAIDGGVIGPCAGSCGTAAYRGQQVIVEDIATDPLWAEYRDAALLHSLRACWSTPIFSSQGKVIATFAMYYREPRSPSLRDQQIFDQITVLAGIAIERKRAEEALRASEQLARSHVEVMMRSLDVLATEAVPEKFTAEILRTIGQHLRASRVLLWLHDQADDSIRLRLVVEGDQQVAPHPDHPFVKDPHGWKQKSGLVDEMCFTKSPLVFDEVEHDARIGPEFREYLTRRRCKKFMTVPMFVAGELRGFIGIQHSEQGAYRAEQIELAQALAHHVMMAVHEQELDEQERQAAILKERTRMARDIHDTLAQGFTGVIMQMEAAEEALMEEDPEHAVRHVRQARDLAREGLHEARRSVHALRPQALEKAAFPEALKAIIQNTTEGTSLRAEFQLEGEPCALAAGVEENLLHIGQEALSNALKYAYAKRFETRVAFEPQGVRLELCDDGAGFVVERASGGIGLIGMRERAEHIGGTLAISSAPGKGTRIVVVAPYQQEGSA